MNLNQLNINFVKLFINLWHHFHYNQYFAPINFLPKVIIFGCKVELSLTKMKTIKNNNLVK